MLLLLSGNNDIWECEIPKLRIVIKELNAIQNKRVWAILSYSIYLE